MLVLGDTNGSGTGTTDGLVLVLVSRVDGVVVAASFLVGVLPLVLLLVLGTTLRP